MLSEILGFCKELKLNKIIINNHVILDTTYIDPNGVKLNRYWIDLN